MPVEATQSVSAAINEVTDESLGTTDAGEDGEEVIETETAAETEEAADDTEEGSESEEEAEEEEPEAEPEEDEEFDIFDTLTPEQNQAINDNPELKQLRKALLKGYESKTTELKQLIQLGEAWKQSPRKVVEALAQSLNLSIADAKAVAQVAGATATAAAATTTPQPDPLEDAGKELEALFGKDLGPRVRGVFEKWADARIGKRIDGELTPIKGTLGRVVNTNEQSRMLSEEATFKQRKGKDLSPAVEARIVALGNSGKYIPGQGMTPQEYLDSLYDLATAQISRETAKKATGTAAKQLARKIEANRRGAEPAGRSGRGGSVKPVSKVSEARSISEALDIAEAELQAEGL